MYYYKIVSNIKEKYFLVFCSLILFLDNNDIFKLGVCIYFNKLIVNL